MRHVKLADGVACKPRRAHRSRRRERYPCSGMATIFYFPKFDCKFTISCCIVIHICNPRHRTSEIRFGSYLTSIGLADSSSPWHDSRKASVLLSVPRILHFYYYSHRRCDLKVTFSLGREKKKKKKMNGNEAQE
ncbi:hypothetical protein BDV41DRAFT_306179 [Aspergillus transmontanensis]|uniref:Uncharacterized protein n=1 Tax=Aspergillus transmontanensis TaxID=1034304 RepID=A0A5N6VUC6_9EURO|nr:hypothetical protein BDV41DRAFT_306179 [Aspergillus transmontanensis]